MMTMIKDHFAALTTVTITHVDQLRLSHAIVTLEPENLQPLTNPTVASRRLVSATHRTRWLHTDIKNK